MTTTMGHQDVEMRDDEIVVDPSLADVFQPSHPAQPSQQLQPEQPDIPISNESEDPATIWMMRNSQPIDDSHPAHPSTISTPAAASITPNHPSLPNPSNSKPQATSPTGPTPSDLAAMQYMNQTISGMTAFRSSLESENKRLRETAGRVLVRVLPGLGVSASLPGVGGGTGGVGTGAAGDGKEDSSFGDDQFTFLAGAVAAVSGGQQIPVNTGVGGIGVGAGAGAGAGNASGGEGSVGDVLIQSMREEIESLKTRLEELNGTGNGIQQTDDEPATGSGTATREELSVLHDVVEKLQMLKSSAEARRETLRSTLSTVEGGSEGKKDGMKDYRQAMEVWKAVRDARGYVETMLKCYKETSSLPPPLTYQNPAYATLSHSLPLPASLTSSLSHNAAVHSTSSSTPTLPITLHPAYIPEIFSKRKGRPPKAAQDLRRAQLEFGMYPIPGGEYDDGMAAYEGTPSKASIKGKGKEKVGSAKKNGVNGGKGKMETPVKGGKRVGLPGRSLGTPLGTQKTGIPQGAYGTPSNAATTPGGSFPIPANPDTPARDPAATYFSTQIPYQLQIAQMAAEGRWPPQSSADEGRDGAHHQSDANSGMDMASLIAAGQMHLLPREGRPASQQFGNDFSGAQGTTSSSAGFPHHLAESMNGHPFLTSTLRGDVAEDEPTGVTQSEQQSAEQQRVENEDVNAFEDDEDTSMMNLQTASTGDPMFGGGDQATNNGAQPGSEDVSLDYLSFNGAKKQKRKRTGDDVGGTDSDLGGGSTCPNCGTIITTVWRKLTVNGQDYRVCNACGLHYHKNGVMRPQALWGDPNAQPKKRRHANPKIKRAPTSAYNPDEAVLDRDPNMSLDGHHQAQHLQQQQQQLHHQQDDRFDYQREEETFEQMGLDAMGVQELAMAATNMQQEATT